MTRKRFVKLMMAEGWSRNAVNKLAYLCRKRQDGRISGRAEGCHGRGIAAAGVSTGRAERGGS